MTIRVLHIVANMNRGGLENFIMNVYRTLDREQVQFDFLVTREVKGAFDDEIRLLGGRIYNIPEMAKVGYRKYKRILYMFFKQHPEYQIVHCHRDALCGIYLKQAKRVGITNRIAHSHTSKIGEPLDFKGVLRSIVKQYFKYSTQKYATQYFACAKLAGEWLFGKSISTQNFKVLNNGIDSRDYKYEKRIREQVRDELGIGEEIFVIGHVGRFNYPKNHEFIIKVFANVNKKIPQSRLCLVGDGDLQKVIKQKVRELGIEKQVMFLGVREDVNKILQAFDVFAFPSRFEGIPVTLVEAQTSGVRCMISSKITKESDLGVGLLEYLSIDEELVWEERLCDLYKQLEDIRKERKTNSKQISASGYDVQKVSDYLQAFYKRQWIEQGGKRK